MSKATAAISVDTARSLLASGLSVLPAWPSEKRPAINAGWDKYKSALPSEDEISSWFSRLQEGLCLICGKISGNLEMIDFDLGGEAFEPWCELVRQADPSLLERLVIEQSPSGGWHVVYRCQKLVCGNMKLAQRDVDGKITTLIETRGEGGLFLCAPTPGYELLQGEFTRLAVLSEEERETLLRCAWELNEYICDVVDGPQLPATKLPADSSGRPGDDYNARGDLRSLLVAHGWACVKKGDNQYWRRPGKNKGWSATFNGQYFYVFSSNAVSFEQNRAYSRFAVYALLEHNGDFSAATQALAAQGYGDAAATCAGVDLSGIVATPVENQTSQAFLDPGSIPEHLFEVPGFVGMVCDFTLANAPYPSAGLAFCGAMSLQSYLCGRKVRTSCDLRPNLYLLALASSGSGKDFPRKVNSRVLFEIGRISALGDKFASGEGIQDALIRSNAMLFQNDEMDGVLRQINLDREEKRESIPNILLTLYTSAADIYPTRVKAGQKETIHIDQPHMTLFGTATPRFFYESLSQRMLANGLFARMMIIDIGRRGRGQTPGSARDLPESVLQTAHWWEEFCPGRRKNLYEVHPDPQIVPFSPEANQAVEDLQRMGEDEYDKAHAANDEVGKAVWARTCENAKKLALIYACSENHENPVISLKAVEWATAFAMHQTRRQLYLASSYVAENPFHAQCLKFTRLLAEAPDRQMQRQHMLRSMRGKAADFDQLVSTLIQQGEIVPVDIRTKTKPAQGYRLV